MRALPVLPEGVDIMPYADRGNPLHWQCPKCAADPGVKCFVRVPGGELRLNHDYGTHFQRKRLALFMEHNPDHPFDSEVWKFAVNKREY